MISLMVFIFRSFIMYWHVSFGSEIRVYRTEGENTAFLVRLLILTDFNFSFLGQEIFNKSNK